MEDRGSSETRGRKGDRVWIGYGKLRIGEKWWTWEEDEGVLKDERGNNRRDSGSGEWAEGGSRK